ncbi:hypothetical protein HY994_04315 [Candidatus Micrarchaeota archaeon]|nr:hypothetical protein [Candidatus Micrarchaeota archaeon]
MVSFGSATARQSNPFLFVFLASIMAVMISTSVYASFAPGAGTGGSLTSEYLNITDTIVVQPGGNVTFKGSIINASNVSQALPSFNITAKYNATWNATMVVTGGFGLNLSAPNMTRGFSGGFGLENVTVYTNGTDNHSKTLHFFISNATNVSVVILTQKPPFALSSNNTVNITYYNGSTPLANNIPYLQVLNSSGQIDRTGNIQLYNLSAKTNAQGIIQYNISVSSNALGQYVIIVDYGLASFNFESQTAFDSMFITQTTSGESRSSFSSSNNVSLIDKTRYANGTAYDLTASDYLTAFITLPNNTVYTVNLSATNASSNPGANNKTFSGATLPGTYSVRVEGTIQGQVYQSKGQFEVRTGFARLAAGSDFFQNQGAKSVILPNSTVRFNILLYNNSDDSLIGSESLGNCSSAAIVFNGFTDLSNGQNTSYYGSAALSEVSYGISRICAITVAVPSTQGDYRVNATLRDPSNSSLTIPAEGIVQVRSYGLRMSICPAVSDFMPCGFVPFVEKNKNVTLEFSVDNFTGGQQLGRSNIINVSTVSVRKFSFGQGSGSESTNWTANSSYFLSYPQTDTSAIRITLDLPDDNSTGPQEVQLTVNTSVGYLSSKQFFMVKGSSVEAHGGPSNGQGGFNPQISCNGTFPFFIEAFDMKSNQPVQGVSVQGVKRATHVISGKILDSTFITAVTTNSTDANGVATYNVTFNTSKSMLTGPYDMILNISYQGTEDEAFSGFMCGSGSFNLFKPGGFDQNQGGQQQQGPNAQFAQGGITGFPAVQPPRAGANDSVQLSFMQVGFGGQSFGGDNQVGQGQAPRMFNGTLKVTGLKFFNKDSGSERSISATGSLSFPVDAGTVGFILQPANFSLTGWPQGFIQLQVNFTNGTTPGIGVGPSGLGQFPGFDSSPFKIFVDFAGLPRSVAVGQNVSLLINASTNVSLVGNNFTMRGQSMTRGTQKAVTLLSAVKLLDYWNTTADDRGLPGGSEQWNITVTVPNMDSGPVKFIVTINNSQSVTNEFEIMSQISGLEVRPMSGFLMFMHAQCQPLDDANQNGTLQNCLPIGQMGGPFVPSDTNFASRMNFSLMNNTYNVSSKSQSVCYKGAINFTGGNLGMGQTASLSNTTYVALFDNLTAGVYDTAVFNSTDSNFTIMSLANLSSANRRFYRINQSWGDIYATMTEGCVMLKLANSSEAPMDNPGVIGLGRNPVNQKFYLAYKVLLGSNAVGGAGVDLLGVANMTVGNAFINMLPASQYVTRSSLSDSRGIAFVEANVSVPGQYMIFWKANASIGGQLVSTFAKLQQDKYSYGGGAGNGIEIMAFNVFCSTSPQMIQSGGQNITADCSANYFNNTPVAGAQFTLSAMDFNSNGAPVALTLSNATSGVIINNQSADGTGMASFNFTKAGGWTQGHGYQLQGVAVSGLTSQQFFSGGIGFYGGSGNFGGQGGP